LGLKVVEGSRDPLQGWLPAGISKVRPAPVGIYTTHAKTTNMLYVLAPAPKGSPDPVRSVEALQGEPTAARITFSDGRVYEVRFNLGEAATWKQIR
jgi:hypothetical protein